MIGCPVKAGFGSGRVKDLNQDEALVHILYRHQLGKHFFKATRSYRCDIGIEPRSFRADWRNRATSGIEPRSFRC